MTTSEIILNYAAHEGGTFLRKDLLNHLASYYPNIQKRNADQQLQRLIASKTLRRKGRGIYMLPENKRTEFLYIPSEYEKELYHKLKKQFPFLSFCIWNPGVLSNYMLHIPMVRYILVDVEKDGMETVFHSLQEMGLGRNILIAPTLLECDRYLTGTDAVVVRQLIGQSPLTEVDGCMVPRMEKILVDAIGDNELQFAGGSEIYNIFENAYEQNNINVKKLMRYASRRNRKKNVEQIIKTIEND